MQIFLDIETAPTEDADTLAAIRAGIRPPANYKKPETIAAWMETEGEAAALDAIGRTALDGAAGQVIAIGIARDNDAPPLVLTRTTDQPEADLLRRFFEVVQDWTAGGAVTDAEGRTVWPDAPYFIAHHAAFDLGFLWRRCIVHGLRPPFALPGPNARPSRCPARMPALARTTDAAWWRGQATGTASACKPCAAPWRCPTRKPRATARKRGSGGRLATWSGWRPTAPETWKPCAQSGTASRR